MITKGEIKRYGSIDKLTKQVCGAYFKLHKTFFNYTYLIDYEKYLIEVPYKPPHENKHLENHFNIN